MMRNKTRQFGIIAAAVVAGATLAGTAAPAMASVPPQQQQQSVSPEMFIGHVNVTLNNLTNETMTLKEPDVAAKTIAVLKPGQNYTVTYQEHGSSASNNNYTMFRVRTNKGEMTVTAMNMSSWWPTFKLSNVPGYGDFNARGFNENELKTFEHDGNMYRIIRLADGDRESTLTKNFCLTIGSPSIWK